APTTEVITDEILQDSSTINISIPTNVISEQENSSNENPNEENKFILSDVVRSSIERIPKRDVQKYLHTVLEKSFDILLMGSPRVGKSTLINAILKKDLAKTSAGRNTCTSVMASYEYEESYTSSIGGPGCSNCHQLPSGGPPMTSSADDFSPTTSTCSIRIWDAPGIEDWIKLDVAKHIQTLVDEKNPICLIYCTSPGSYANVEHIKIVN
ncbi:unnamed protein product, partial [Rotaria magnacalcarata]